LACAQFSNTDHAWKRAECTSVEEEYQAVLGELEDCSLTKKRAIAFIFPVLFALLTTNSESMNPESMNPE
jgi:hypothetical protein